MNRIVLSIVPLLWFMACVPAGTAQAESLQLERLKRDRDLDGIRSFLADSPSLPDATRLRWQAWLSEVDGDRAKARQLLEAAVEKAPGDAEAQIALAELLSRSMNDVSAFGKMRLARRIRDAYAAALAVAPEHPDAHTGLTIYYRMAPRIAGGGMDRAREQVRTVRRFSQDLALALEAMLSDDSEEAIRLMETAVAQAPENAGYRFTLGLLYQTAGQHEQARTAFQHLVANEPAHAAAWYQLGRTAIFSEQNLEEGVSAYEHFLKLPVWPGEPSHAAGWWRLGNLHELQGQADRAGQDYRQALQADEGFEPARDALRELADGSTD